jgi:hypothetical protein
MVKNPLANCKPATVALAFRTVAKGAPAMTARSEAPGTTWLPSAAVQLAAVFPYFDVPPVQV